MSEPKPDGKPFAISKRLVGEAWLRVKANRGAGGIDQESIQAFEANLRGNLYKLWNRMSSGSYMPPPVRAVEIPKKSGGSRMLGVPTVADRVANGRLPVFGAWGGAGLFTPTHTGTGPDGKSEAQARVVLDAIAERLAQVGRELNLDDPRGTCRM